MTSSSPETFRAALAPTYFIQSDAPPIRDFAAKHAGEGSERERAVNLYYAVRDGIRYDPYSMQHVPEAYRATSCLGNGVGYCITKSIVLAAAARAAGIPARLGFADVKNHLSTPRLTEQMGTDIFYYHGYTSLYLDGRWVKATPAFNIELCEKFGVHPLEFDGSADSVFHPYDVAGRQHMEYVKERGEFDDLPFDEIMTCFQQKYPRMMASISGDFAKEAAPIG